MRRLPLVIACLFALGSPAVAEDLRTALVAGGCFWCVESDFDKVDGVRETISGYAGGTTQNPTYGEVSSSDTGHLEVVQITYDADVLSYERLISLFLRSIDPLDADGQFCDRGAVYATAIFAETDEELATAEVALAAAEAELGTPIATTLRTAATFYPAEEGHQNYYKKNPLRYAVYRKGCGRDARVREVWGDNAAFDHNS